MLSEDCLALFERLRQGLVVYVLEVLQAEQVDPQTQVLFVPHNLVHYSGLTYGILYKVNLPLHDLEF